MTRNRTISPTLCAMLCAVLLCNFIFLPLQASANTVSGKYQGQIDQINDRLKNLEAEKKKIQDGINSAKSEKEKQLATKKYLDQQISITKDEITILEERIALLEEDIEDKLVEIDVKQAEYDASYALFLKRVRAMYMYGDASTLGLVLGSDSFVDFLTRNDMVVRVANHDRNLMDVLTSERKALEEQKRALEEQKKQVEADRVTVEEKKQTLSSQQQAASLRIQDLDQQEKEFKADLEKNIAQEKAVQKELDDIYRQIEWDNNPYVGGEMQWPVPNFYKISSPYGWRFDGKDYHTGMDISGTGIYGQNIVAANAGKVVLTNWRYTPGKGYGIYVVIDHGGKTSTLYGHCSNIVVKVGDVVSKGQTIAQIGSTGWSTGPHLHFEVRIDGKHTNPDPYVRGK